MITSLFPRPLLPLYLENWTIKSIFILAYYNSRLDIWIHVDATQMTILILGVSKDKISYLDFRNANR